MRKIASYAVFVLCFFIFCNAEAAIFDVTNVTELQSALTTAQSNGQEDTINLAPGTYTLSSRLDYLPVQSENYSLTIQGAGAWATILDGGNSTSILRIGNGAVSDGTSASVTIRGVTFQNGNESSMEGGALYIGNPYAQTTIEDSVFQNNTAVLGGGALYLSGKSANIAGNIFTGNSSTGLNSTGGAVYATISGGTLTLNENTFSDNFSVGWGAGIYATDTGPIVLTGNTFSSNVAGGEGGGAYLSADFGGSLNLSGNTFTGNSGSSAGGALLSSLTGAATIFGNIFKNNIASTSSESDGGGVKVFSWNSVKMINNLFAGNRTSQRGAGAMISIYSNQNQITNNTFVGNNSTGAYGQAGSQGGGMYVITDRNEAVLNIYNNIFWGNTAAAPGNSGADAYIDADGLNDGWGSFINLYNNDFSNIAILAGDRLSQGGNINGNPMLDLEYRLTVGSPCMDTGNNSAPELPATDLWGDPRVQAGIVDMGAYEWGPTGSLQVTISPQGVVDAWAEWRVDGGDWNGSGYTQKVLVGQHTVEFSDVVGWAKPDNQAVTISAGQMTPITGSYTATGQTGSLRVTISPQAAINAGARWRVDGGIWQGSEYTQTELLVGQHTVQFSDVAGLTEPSIRTVTIVNGATASATGNYGGRIGSLRVTISPQEAKDAGAHWRVQGEGVWHVSGYTQTVSVGLHTVEFSNIARWTKPGNLAVTINEGQTTTPSGTYTQPKGSLKVTISPQKAIDAGAKWRRVGTGTWRDSGTTETQIPIGPYTVEFSTLTGWGKPGNQSVTIVENQMVSISGTYIELPASVMVTILPQAAINAGAQWRLDGGTWLPSGYIQLGLPAGQYTIQFSDVAGWTKPDDLTVTLIGGQTVTTGGNYSLQSGSLQVTINPPEINPPSGGAQWRVDGGTWRVSGYTQTGLSVGQHTVEFKDVLNWTKPGNQPVTISNGVTTNTSGTYTPHIGSLQVTIIPPEAVAAGAKWRRTGTTPWQDSGFTEPGIPVGSYTVEFSDVAGWAKPSDRTVTITKDQTTPITGVYTEPGSLQVTISPSCAVDAGAKWRRTGTTPWLNSGATESGIPVGQQTVEFSDVTGWTKPGNLVVTINNGQTTSATGTYTTNPGSLRVTITPQAAIDAGAQWRVNGVCGGASTWQNSGATESGIPVGQYTVEFKDVSNWMKPGNQAVTIINLQTTTATGTYVPQVGSLRATISPPDAINAGAKWRRTGTSTWRNSGDTEPGIPVGQYTVEFSTLAGWTKPGNQTVTIIEGQITDSSGTYTPALPSGSLRVTISPQDAINAGAKWRRMGTETWQDSGFTEPGIPVGPYTVEFSDAAGWTKPVNRVVTISEGQTATAAGTYILQTGYLRVTISPQGAIDAGAKWRRAGTTTWRNSGTTETGIPVGQHTVEFSDTAGWTKPGNQTVTISNGMGTTATGTYTLQTGSLRVTISPQEAINAGAQWRRTGTTPWLGSGTAETGVPVGQQTVEFNYVSSWNKPGNLTVTITDGPTTDASGTYTPLSGSLQVTISPQGAIDAGAKWRRVGTETWQDSGATESGIPVGSQTVEFLDCPGWTEPANRTVTISNGLTATATGNYILQTGSLRVTINPQGAIDAGARWRRAGTSTWRNSGTTETGIPVGPYAVEFRDVLGWMNPGNQTVAINNSQTTPVTGTYILETGALRVTINPQEAIDAGAQWRVDGGAWHASGDTQTGVSVGQHTVEFSNIAGWMKPGNQTVTIAWDQTTDASGTYIRQTGSLRVTISPQGAINAGAKWRRVGTDTWRDSGTTETGIPVGGQTVEFFSDVTGWTKPGNRTVTIGNGQTATTTGNYVPLTGSLQVTIFPQEAINAGAKWRRAGTSTWRNSGTTESGIPVGQHTVEFSGAAGWAKPDSQLVTINDLETTTATGNYTPPAGSLRVTINPQGAIDAGAKWRRTGTSTWQDSGATESGIPIGQHTVEFSNIAGWTKSNNLKVTISNGQTVVTTGTYVLQTGSLQVTISPQGAIDAGAQWRRAGTDAWRGSGTTETGIPLGQHVVEFNDVPGWTRPVNMTVTINNGQKATATGTYTP